jgi:hypothetical protein
MAAYRRAPPCPSGPPPQAALVDGQGQPSTSTRTAQPRLGSSIEDTGNAKTSLSSSHSGELERTVADELTGARRVAEAGLRCTNTGSRVSPMSASHREIRRVWDGGERRPGQGGGEIGSYFSSPCNLPNSCDCGSKL